MDFLRKEGDCSGELMDTSRFGFNRFISVITELLFNVIIVLFVTVVSEMEGATVVGRRRFDGMDQFGIMGG